MTILYLYIFSCLTVSVRIALSLYRIAVNRERVDKSLIRLVYNQKVLRGIVVLLTFPQILCNACNVFNREAVVENISWRKEVTILFSSIILELLLTPHTMYSLSTLQCIEMLLLYGIFFLVLNVLNV